MSKCKHKNTRMIETIAAHHAREIVDGIVFMNNEYGDGISREMKCLDCGKVVQFNWRKKYPKWIDERLKEMKYYE